VTRPIKVEIAATAEFAMQPILILFSLISRFEVSVNGLSYISRGVLTLVPDQATSCS
jgi:hypothetical protein